MQSAQDMTAFFQLLHAIGVPGIVGLIFSPVIILAMLLFIFLKGDQKKWEGISAQNDTRWKEMLEAHKTERDRDFKHLQDLMESLNGQYQILTTLVSKVDQVDRGIESSFASLPTAFRDLHARFDQMFSPLPKGSHVRNFGAQGPASVP